MIPRILVPACTLSILVAGCGGGSGSGGLPITSTPTPPTPASYTRIADAVNGGGSYSFQATGVSYNASPAGFSGASSFVLGSGAAVSYNAPNDSFTVTAAGGSGVTFTAANLQPSGPGTVRLVKSSGAVVDDLTLTIPLTYAMVAVWNQQQPSGNTGRLLIAGSPTQTADVPKTGSASYSVSIGGAAQSNGTTYNLTSSTGTFTANFGSGTVQTTMNLAGPPLAGGAVANLGSVTGSGSLSSGGPGFAGTLSGPAGTSTGIFQGAFFGPQAAEMGYGWVLPGSTLSAAGVALGTKQ